MVEQAENTELENADLNQDQEGQEESQNNSEFEINLGDSPSQQPQKKGNPVVQRVIGQRDKARDEAAAVKSENEKLREQLQRIQAGQNNSAPAPSSPPEFFDFDSEEDYRASVIAWNKSQSSAPQVNSGVNQFQQFIANQAAEKAINDHYSRAEALAEKFPDYSIAEKAANEALGSELALEVARLSDRSAELMLYFGRNPQEAKRFADLASQDGTRAAIELGRMEAKLNIQQKNIPLPDPDEPLEGGESNAVSSFERRLKSARASGNTREAIAIRKEARASGIILD